MHSVQAPFFNVFAIYLITQLQVASYPLSQVSSSSMVSVICCNASSIACMVTWLERILFLTYTTSESLGWTSGVCWTPTAPMSRLFVVVAPPRRLGCICILVFVVSQIIQTWFWVSAVHACVKPAYWLRSTGLRVLSFQHGTGMRVCPLHLDKAWITLNPTTYE